MDLQQRMIGHYKKLNKFAQQKLKATQEKLKEAKGKCPAPKLKKDTSKLQIWPQLHNMFLKTLEGHARQNWAKFDKFWFFIIFGFLANTHGHRHFCLGHPKRMKMVSLDAIVLGAYTQRFSDQLNMIFSPKMAENTHFFHTLPRLSTRSIFLGFYTQVSF